MTLWPISFKVNKPDNDDASILAPTEPGPNLDGTLDLDG
jgi:hypothetical protein